jgi:DNA helicase II / ATP-dependent DNA helicase PcrA
MPIVHARTAEAIEEERRLLYVAVTRARVHLALSWAAARTPPGPGTPGAGASGSAASGSAASGSPVSRQRSRFLAAMQAPAMAAGR